MEKESSKILSPFQTIDSISPLAYSYPLQLFYSGRLVEFQRTFSRFVEFSGVTRDNINNFYIELQSLVRADHLTSTTLAIS